VDREEFGRRYGPWAVVAGASEGIGADFARLLAEQGLNLVLVARKPEPLQALAAEVRDRSGVEVRAESVDLTADDVMERIGQLTDDVEIGSLVYNAGAESGRGLLLGRSLEHSRGMIRLNCDTPVRMIYHFASPMTERGRGGVVLVTSTGSTIGIANLAVYSAVKSFEKILSEGLWMELGQSGVDLLGLVASLTNTPAMHRGGFLDPENPEGAADPAWVAEVGLQGLYDRVGPLLQPGVEPDGARADAVVKTGVAMADRYGEPPLRDFRVPAGT
jgi:short-subunit dehydrogenase